MIRSSDTDVVIILVSMIAKHKLSNETKNYGIIIMDSGVGNKRRFINLSELSNDLECKTPGLPTALPGLHAFTGTDYNSAFYRKGKNIPFQILENDSKDNSIKT